MPKCGRRVERGDVQRPPDHVLLVPAVNRVSTNRHQICRPRRAPSTSSTTTPATREATQARVRTWRGEGLRVSGSTARAAVAAEATVADQLSVAERPPGAPP